MLHQKREFGLAIFACYSNAPLLAGHDDADPNPMNVPCSLNDSILQSFLPLLSDPSSLFQAPRKGEPEKLEELQGPYRQYTSMIMLMPSVHASEHIPNCPLIFYLRQCEDWLTDVATTSYPTTVIRDRSNKV